MESPPEEAPPEEPQAIEPELKALAPETKNNEVVQLALKVIQPNPYQPRLQFEKNELETLKNSISKAGIIQPVLVRQVQEGYQLVAGERRYRAAQELGFQAVPAIVVEVPDDRMLEMALIENLHRQNLNPIDTAKAFQNLLKIKAWTQESLAQQLGLSRPSVSNYLRLLELPENIQLALAREQIQIGHAKVLLSVANPQEQQRLFEKIAEDRLSVREVEIAREALAVQAQKEQAQKQIEGAEVKAAPPKKRSRRISPKDANLIGLEEELSQALGTRVTIHHKKGRGIIRIEFYSPEDFEAVRGLLLAALVKK
ncbi:MAG: ParB/RepB/Spo0J family partition protein [Planctomycetes bacterium]|nr:ParB/RepB/Spo0J family partition protein [Planctomycetota bacterium]